MDKLNAAAAAPKKHKFGESKPAPLEGWLEKKGNAKVSIGNDWQRR